MCPCEQLENNYTKPLVEFVQELASKAKFEFLYKIIPGMVCSSARTLEPLSFDGLEVHFLWRAFDSHIIRHRVKLASTNSEEQSKKVIDLSFKEFEQQVKDFLQPSIQEWKKFNIH